MKKCPFCAEEIQDEAIVCRYCGRDLIAPVNPPTAAVKAVAAPAEKQELTGGDILLALAIPLAGFVLSLVYIAKPESRERGFGLILVSIVAWIIWYGVCVSSGMLSGWGY